MPETPCIEWHGWTLPNGYGIRKIPGTRKNTTAHRVEWIKRRGPIPAGLHVLHRCDNRPCINIEHLWLGTRQDNMDDMKAKGRQSRIGLRGSAHPRAKVSEEDVLAIRAAGVRTGRRRRRGTGARVAAQYGLPVSYIYELWSNKNWNHLKGVSHA